MKRKREAETQLQQWNSSCQEKPAPFFKMENNLVVCRAIRELMTTLNMDYVSKDWRSYNIKDINGQFVRFKSCGDFTWNSDQYRKKIWPPKESLESRKENVNSS